MRRDSKTGIHDKRYTWKASAERPESVFVVQTESCADWSAPRHQDFAARRKQPFRDREVLRSVRKHFKPFAAQGFSGFDKAENVRLEGIVVINDFQLNPICAEQFARHPGCCDRFPCRVASRGVRENAHSQPLDQIPEIVASLPCPEFAPHRNRRNLGARLFKRPRHHCGRWVLSRSEHQRIAQYRSVKRLHVSRPAWEPQLPADPLL